jgi:predicted DNA-binding transcriptional regulator AlpA
LSADFDLITSTELSELLRTPTKTLEHWRYVGAGPRFARIGRRVMYRKSDVEEWLTSAFESA